LAGNRWNKRAAGAPKAGLTQEQLALEAAIDLTYVGGIERGKRNPSVLILARIADALDTTPADLLHQQSG